tara:strand:- start:192 stop:851 length:660 start_codon:yes stop_codon:yes gene_type:complete
MLTSTVENYLKALLMLSNQGEKRVSTGDLSKSLGVTPGSATSMIKTLAEAGLANHKSHYGVLLTDEGRTLAVHVVRRHRIIELFLVNILEMEWDEVHAEAEKLEHVVSDEVIGRMDKLLDYPTLDPHGDPIPTQEGKFIERPLHQLSQCEEGQRVQVARISDQNSSFLKFAESHGLTPGATIEVQRRNKNADSITLRSSEEEITLGFTAAKRIEVELVT